MNPRWSTTPTRGRVSSTAAFSTTGCAVPRGAVHGGGPTLDLAAPSSRGGRSPSWMPSALLYRRGCRDIPHPGQGSPPARLRPGNGRGDRRRGAGRGGGALPAQGRVDRARAQFPPPGACASDEPAAARRDARRHPGHAPPPAGRRTRRDAHCASTGRAGGCWRAFSDRRGARHDPAVRAAQCVRTRHGRRGDRRRAPRPRRRAERILCRSPRAGCRRRRSASRGDPVLGPLRARFDRVEPLEDVLGPLHPSSWEPAEGDLRSWSGCSYGRGDSILRAWSCSCRARRSRRPAP